MKSQNGQALIESVVSYTILFVVTFCAIEFVRLQSFKYMLQSSVNYYSKYISLNEMHLIRENILDINLKTDKNDKKLDKTISSAISQDLKLLGSSLVSFDEGLKSIKNHNVLVTTRLFLNQTQKHVSGVYLSATTCLPVLSSSFLNKFWKGKEIIIGRKSFEDSYQRDCIGEFTASANVPKIWFKISAEGYSPWPASTQIFYHGLAIPKNISLIDQTYQKKFNQNFNKVKMTNVLQ